MEVLCQWCDQEDPDAKVPLIMFHKHIQLVHPERMSEIIVESHGGDDLEELKAAHIHLLDAQSQCDRSDYATSREYKIVSEKLQFIIDDLTDLIYIAERFQR